MNFINILYPRRCALCDGLLLKNEKYVCLKCAKNIKFIKDRTCAVCGRVLHSRYETICGVCLKEHHEFDEAFAPFSYSGAIKDSLIRFKYYGRARYSEFYAVSIAKYGAARFKYMKPDMLIPVPVHYSRFVKRGYNQAELLSRSISRLTGIPTCEKVIIRTKKTEAQKELGPMQRRENLKNAFTYIYQEKLPQRVMIVDDIFTTGSTADAISHILRSHGARYIYVVCVGVS